MSAQYEHVEAKILGITLQFDPKADFLGSGTIGEVFRATRYHDDAQDPAAQKDELPPQYALKRFYNRAGRDDFDNECTIADALAAVPHDSIVPCLASWSTGPDSSYMLFPLASGDLQHLLRTPSPDAFAKANQRWLVAQLRNLCSALAYIHDYSVPSSDPPLHRSGFHHDLKPDNILIFPGRGDFDTSTWKFCDFGSGTIKFLPAEAPSKEIYNRKPSTGDPIYSAPEYVIEGRVARSKDVWSLGCVYLEVLVWMLSSDGENAVNRFQAARDAVKGDSPEGAPTYWCKGDDGLPYVNPAVPAEMDEVERLCRGDAVLLALVKVVRRMVVVEPLKRPTAAEWSEFGFVEAERAVEALDQREDGALGD